MYAWVKCSGQCYARFCESLSILPSTYCCVFCCLPSPACLHKHWVQETWALQTFYYYLPGPQAISLSAAWTDLFKHQNTDSQLSMYLSWSSVITGSVLWKPSSDSWMLSSYAMFTRQSTQWFVFKFLAGCLQRSFISSIDIETSDINER